MNEIVTDLVQCEICKDRFPADEIATCDNINTGLCLECWKEVQADWKAELIECDLCEEEYPRNEMHEEISFIIRDNDKMGWSHCDKDTPGAVEINEWYCEDCNDNMCDNCSPCEGDDDDGYGLGSYFAHAMNKDD
jgi:hypothetical protein